MSKKSVAKSAVSAATGASKAKKDKDQVPASISQAVFMKDFQHLGEKEKKKKTAVYHYTLRKAKKATKENGVPLEANFIIILDEQK